MSKDWIGYHNFNNLKKNYRDLAESVLYTMLRVTLDQVIKCW